MVAASAQSHGMPHCSQDEALLHLQLFREWDGRPPPEAIRQLSARLREMNPELAEASPSYRSAGSVGQHVYFLRLLQLGDPRAEEAPTVLRDVWSRHLLETDAPLR